MTHEATAQSAAPITSALTIDPADKAILQLLGELWAAAGPGNKLAVTVAKVVEVIAARVGNDEDCVRAIWTSVKQRHRSRISDK